MPRIVRRSVELPSGRLSFLKGGGAGPLVMLVHGNSSCAEADALAYATSMLGRAQLVTPAFLQATRRTDGAARYWMVRNGVEGRGVDQVEPLRQAAIPVAIVQGREDPFLKAGYLERLPATMLWRGAVQWLTGLGHAPHIEAPALFNDYMFAFLRDQTADTGFGPQRELAA